MVNTSNSGTRVGNLDLQAGGTGLGGLFGAPPIFRRRPCQN